MIPTRIVVDAEGQARPPQPGDRWDVVFVRTDGWTLGAPLKFREVARQLWEGSWLRVIHCPQTRIPGRPALTHDVTDPGPDADARGLRFTEEQASWINHHIRNGMVLLLDPDPTTDNLAKFKRRMLSICEASCERREA
jgi:hypothetical protein